MFIELVHIGSSILTGYMYPPKLPVVSQWMWFSIGSTVVVSFLGSMRENKSERRCSFIFSVASTGKVLGEFLKAVTWLNLLVLDLVSYLCVLVISTMRLIFGVFKLLVSHKDALLVYLLLLSQFHF